MPRSWLDVGILGEDISTDNINYANECTDARAKKVPKSEESACTAHGTTSSCSIRQDSDWPAVSATGPTGYPSDPFIFMALLDSVSCHLVIYQREVWNVYTWGYFWLGQRVYCATFCRLIRRDRVRCTVRGGDACGEVHGVQLIQLCIPAVSTMEDI